MAIDVLAHQAVTHPNTVVSATIDLADIVEYHMEFFHAFNQSAPNTNVPSFLVQVSQDDEIWRTAATHAIATTGTPGTEVFTATEPIGETSIAVADASKFAAGDLIYIRDTVLVDSEWAYVQEVDTTPAEFVILATGLIRAHALTTTSLFSDAEMFATAIDVKAQDKLRVIYLHEGATGADTHIKVTGRALHAAGIHSRHH